MSSSSGLPHHSRSRHRRQSRRPATAAAAVATQCHSSSSRLHPIDRRVNSIRSVVIPVANRVRELRSYISVFPDATKANSSAVGIRKHRLVDESHQNPNPNQNHHCDQSMRQKRRPATAAATTAGAAGSLTHSHTDTHNDIVMGTDTHSLLESESGSDGNSVDVCCICTHPTVDYVAVTTREIRKSVHHLLHPLLPAERKQLLLIERKETAAAPRCTTKLCANASDDSGDPHQSFQSLPLLERMAIEKKERELALQRRAEAVSKVKGHGASAGAASPFNVHMKHMQKHEAARYAVSTLFRLKFPKEVAKFLAKQSDTAFVLICAQCSEMYDINGQIQQERAHRQRQSRKDLHQATFSKIRSTRMSRVLSPMSLQHYTKEADAQVARKSRPQTATPTLAVSPYPRRTVSHAVKSAESGTPNPSTSTLVSSASYIKTAHAIENTLVSSANTDARLADTLDRVHSKPLGRDRSSIQDLPAKVVEHRRFVYPEHQVKAMAHSSWYVGLSRKYAARAARHVLPRPVLRLYQDSSAPPQPQSCAPVSEHSDEEQATPPSFETQLHAELKAVVKDTTEKELMTDDEFDASLTSDASTDSCMSAAMARLQSHSMDEDLAGKSDTAVASKSASEPLSSNHSMVDIRVVRVPSLNCLLSAGVSNHSQTDQPTPSSSTETTSRTDSSSPRTQTAEASQTLQAKPQAPQISEASVSTTPATPAPTVSTTTPEASGTSTPQCPITTDSESPTLATTLPRAAEPNELEHALEIFPTSHTRSITHLERLLLSTHVTAKHDLPAAAPHIDLHRKDRHDCQAAVSERTWFDPEQVTECIRRASTYLIAEWLSSSGPTTRSRHPVIPYCSTVAVTTSTDEEAQLAIRANAHFASVLLRSMPSVFHQLSMIPRCLVSWTRSNQSFIVDVDYKHSNLIPVTNDIMRNAVIDRALVMLHIAHTTSNVKLIAESTQLYASTDALSDGKHDGEDPPVCAVDIDLRPLIQKFLEIPRGKYDASSAVQGIKYFRPELLQHRRQLGLTPLRLEEPKRSFGRRPSVMVKPRPCTSEILLNLLLNSVIPRAAHRLHLKTEDAVPSDIRDIMHTCGVNMSFLGHILTQLEPHSHIHSLCFEEMCARTIKSQLVPKLLHEANRRGIFIANVHLIHYVRQALVLVCLSEPAVPAGAAAGAAGAAAAASSSTTGTSTTRTRRRSSISTVRRRSSIVATRRKSIAILSSPHRRQRLQFNASDSTSLCLPLLRSKYLHHMDVDRISSTRMPYNLSSEILSSMWSELQHCATRRQRLFTRVVELVSSPTGDISESHSSEFMASASASAAASLHECIVAPRCSATYLDPPSNVFWTRQLNATLESIHHMIDIVNNGAQTHYPMHGQKARPSSSSSSRSSRSHSRHRSRTRPSSATKQLRTLQITSDCACDEIVEALSMLPMQVLIQNLDRLHAITSTLFTLNPFMCAGYNVLPLLGEVYMENNEYLAAEDCFTRHLQSINKFEALKREQRLLFPAMQGVDILEAKLIVLHLLHDSHVIRNAPPAETSVVLGEICELEENNTETLDQLANACIATGDYDRASQVLMSLYCDLVQTLGPLHRDLLSPLQQLTETLTQTRQFHQAIAFAEKVVALLRKLCNGSSSSNAASETSSSDKLLLGEALLTLGKLQLSVNAGDRAIQTLRDACSNASFAETNEDLWIYLGQSEARGGHHRAAISSWKHALDILESKFAKQMQELNKSGSDSAAAVAVIPCIEQVRKTADTLFESACAHVKLDMTAEAHDMFIEAQSVYQGIGDHTSVGKVALRVSLLRHHSSTDLN
jgi:tetratricopeptide (TPR) repeat protein